MTGTGRTACCLALLAAALGAQVPIAELETTSGQNDTFALAEDCRNIGNHFVISAQAHSGGVNSDDEWFMFNGNAGATLDIDMTVTLMVSSYQHNIWLYDSTEHMVAAWNTGSSQPSGASIGMETYTLPATDTYYIYITEWSVSPQAILQPGITTTPLSTRGFEVTGATPDSTRNTAGTLQTVGAQYDITVQVSSGNEGGPTCVINQPAPPGPFLEVITVDHDVDDPYLDPVDAIIEFSTDAGATFTTCTASPTSPIPNPDSGITTPAPGRIFEWDSLGDTVGLAGPTPVDLRISLNNPTAGTTGECVVTVDVDNRSYPSCVITAPAPASTVDNDVDVVLDVDDRDQDPVSAMLEWSTDGGVTYQTATLAAVSPLPTNPAPGLSTPGTGQTFTWDSRTDGIGLMAPEPADLRVTVDDGLLHRDCTVSLTVDNTQICTGICGDCNLDASGPAITDALTAAQISAGLSVPGTVQAACCDVNTDGSVTILDALNIARHSAGLSVTLTCL
jgi:hypothetical protein